MANSADVQYVSDVDGNTISVVVPIDLWREIESERETAYLLQSETMKQRLLDAKERKNGISLEDARAQLGILFCRLRGFGMVGAARPQKGVAYHQLDQRTTT